MQVIVSGDENEIQIVVGELTYTGDLYQASEDADGGGEIWEIDGLMLEAEEQVLCKAHLESLARDFLAQRGISFSTLVVHSSSFPE